MADVKRVFGVVIGFGALGGALACGPSFQAIYEGNARFEHCYALEESAQKPATEKVDCWRDWSEHYTYGQTRDRIHYATARYVALSQSASVPTDEAMMMAAPGMTPRQSTITAPAPTNAFEPPPKVLADVDGGGLIGGKALRPNELPKTVVFSGGSATALDASAPAPPVVAAPPDAALAPAPRTPGTDCADSCGATFRTCKGAPCEKTYRACMRACFK